MSSNPTSCWMQEDNDGNYVLLEDYERDIESKRDEIADLQYMLDEIKRVIMGDNQ